MKSSAADVRHDRYETRSMAVRHEQCAIQGRCRDLDDCIGNSEHARLAYLGLGGRKVGMNDKFTQKVASTGAH